LIKNVSLGEVNYEVETELKLGDLVVKAARSMYTQGNPFLIFSLCLPVSLSLSFLLNWQTVVSVTARIMRLAKNVMGVHSPSVEERMYSELALLRPLKRKAF
jgi:hypothetical protein